MFQSVYAEDEYKDGYDDGRVDLIDGRDYNPYCSPNNPSDNPDAYCRMYKIGYNAGWYAAWSLYG